MPPISRGLSRTQVDRLVHYPKTERSGVDLVNRLVGHQAARANRHIAPHKIAFVGHSFIEGSVTSLVDQRMSSRFRDIWRLRYPTVTADGVVHTSGGKGWINQTTLWTQFTLAGGAILRVSGASSAPYGTGLYVIEIPVGGSATLVYTGTDITAYTAMKTGHGTIRCAIDGGANDTKDVGASASAQDLVPWLVPSGQGLTTGSHTAVFTATTATVYLDGVFVMDGDKDAGTHVWNCGHGGATSKDFNLIASGYVSRWTGYLAKYVIPQTVIVCGLYNDWRLAVSNATVEPAASKAQYEILIDTFNSIPGNGTPLPTIVLVHEPACNTTPLNADFYHGTEGWAEYTDVVYELEREYDNVVVFDVGRLLPPPYEDLLDRSLPYNVSTNPRDPYDLWHFDYVHPNIKGNGWWADKLVDFLAQ
jgi:lysophospholipase L1-like esterase